MKSSKLLLADAFINLILGILLATFPKSVVAFLGVPDSSTEFYPSILGAVLIGIAVALVIEYRRRPTQPAGLGLYGAISINLLGAVFLTGWLLLGGLTIPVRGKVFLWAMVGMLLVVSVLELVGSRGD
jgi:hypothetical protein